MKGMKYCDIKEAIRLSKIAAHFGFSQALQEFERVRRRVGERRYDSIVRLIASSW